MNKTKKRKKTYLFVDFVLYEYITGDPKELKTKQKPAFVHQGVHYYSVSFKDTNATLSLFSASDFPQDVIGKRTFRWQNAKDIGNPFEQNPVYENIIELLQKDDDFDGTYQNLTVYYDSVGCIKIRSVEENNSKGERTNILDRNLTDDTNVDIYYYFINTPLKTDAETNQERY